MDKNRVQNFLDKWRSTDTLVFSGGGQRCIYHLGALKYIFEYLSDHGVSSDPLQSIQRFAGSSGGSILGGFLAINIPLDDIITYFIEEDMWSIINPSLRGIFSRAGLSNNSFIQEALRSFSNRFLPAHLQDITLKQIQENFCRHVVFPTVCLVECSLEDCSQCLVYLSPTTFPDLPLYKALSMSSCIPGVIDPIEWEGRWYVDGGCLDNFPIHLFPADRVLGFNLITPRIDFGLQRESSLLVPTAYPLVQKWSETPAGSVVSFLRSSETEEGTPKKKKGILSNLKALVCSFLVNETSFLEDEVEMDSVSQTNSGGSMIGLMYGLFQLLVYTNNHLLAEIAQKEDYQEKNCILTTGANNISSLSLLSSTAKVDMLSEGFIQTRNWIQKYFGSTSMGSATK